MVQDLSRKEEQRGSRQAYMWGLGIAAMVAVIAIGGLVLTNSYVAPDRAGMEETTQPQTDLVNEPRGETVGAATIATRDDPELGTYLTDGFGRAVYLFEGDEQAGGQEQAESKCYEDCAKVWPPVTSASAPAAEGQVDAGRLGLVERRDGSAQQVTYDGWPLYHFAKDFGPREATGQDVEDFGAEWYLVTPQGEKVGNEAEGTG
jgi:predicted lipoprotein with Yx(FWY)xxD motif